LGEGRVAQDTRIVDDDINASEGVHSTLNDSLPILNAVGVGDRLSTRSVDLVGHLLSNGDIRTAPQTLLRRDRSRALLHRGEHIPMRERAPRP